MSATHASFPELPVVVGVVNAALRVKQISATVRGALGHDPAACVGVAALAAVHPEDISSSLLGLAQAVGSCTPVNLAIRLRRKDGGWMPTELLVVPLLPPAPIRLGFVARPVGSDRTKKHGERLAIERVAALEAITRRVTLENGLTAITPPRRASVRIDYSLLTRREIEILDHLASGQRVAGISRALFLSRSTVRNHLSSIYRKLAVHSQTELLDLINSGLLWATRGVETGAAGLGGSAGLGLASGLAGTVRTAIETATAAETAPDAKTTDGDTEREAHEGRSDEDGCR